MKTEIIKYPRSFNFRSYNIFLTELADNDLCTGELSEEHIQATRMNMHRIKRINKQIEIVPTLKKAMELIKNKLEWIILVESWCGDGAQNLPIIAKMATLSDNINLVIILRDENSEMMNMHLTNGAKAIPKLICINATSREEIGVWGPRPAVIQEKVKKLKTDYPSITPDEFSRNLHLWYANDKGLSLQNEFISLINEWTTSSYNTNPKQTN